MSTDRLEAGTDLRGGGFPSLGERPDLYPGIPETLDDPAAIARWPADYLVAAFELWTLSLEQGERIAGARVHSRESGAPAPADAPGLESALARLRSPGLPERIPAIAIGSNAYPRQIADKLAGDPDLGGKRGARTVPAFRGVLENVEIVYCPRRASKGYVPVTPRYRHGARSLAWLQLLTPAQLDVVWRSEGPYDLLSLRPAPRGLAFTLQASGQELREALIFWSPAALALNPGREPEACRGTGPGGAAREGLSQRGLLELLGPDAEGKLARGSTPNPPPPGARRVPPEARGAPWPWPAPPP